MPVDATAALANLPALTEDDMPAQMPYKKGYHPMKEDATVTMVPDGHTIEAEDAEATVVWEKEHEEDHWPNLNSDDWVEL